MMCFSIVAEGNSVKITIADNGKGIPPEIADVIFEPFTVGDESRNSRQGTGLGLAIAKKIVEIPQRLHQSFQTSGKRDVNRIYYMDENRGNAVRIVTAFPLLQRSAGFFDPAYRSVILHENANCNLKLCITAFDGIILKYIFIRQGIIGDRTK